MPHVSDLSLSMIAVQDGGLHNASFLALLALARNSALCDNVHMMICTGCFLVTEENAAGVEDGARFYVRSMHFTRDQLQAVLAVYEQQFADPQLCQNYANMLAGAPNINNFYIRYIGCTEASDPENRHRTDLEALPQTRLWNFFCSHESSQPPTNQGLVDATEQILIHLFGRQFLLNSQPGGFYRAYIPEEQDLTIAGLRNDQLLRGLFISGHQQGHVDHEIHQLYQAWYQDYLQDVDPQRAAQLDEALIDLFAQQASSGATTATGLTPLMIFAKDITREDAALLRGFFDGSRAGTLTRDLITLALGAYQERDNFNPPTFHDLWPVAPIPRDQQEQWAPFLIASGNVIQHISPLVLVTLGFDPAAASFSNFRHSYSLGTGEYLEKIGVPFICHTDLEFDYQADENAVPNHQVLTIAHYDPGFMSYGPGDPIILRFMLLTWCRTLALVTCCIKEVEGFQGVGQPPIPQQERAQPGTPQFCNNALERLTQRENGNGFTVIFNQAKAAVKELLHDQHQNIHVASVRRAVLRGDPMPNAWLPNYMHEIGGTVAAKTVRFGYATGQPNSDERLVQCRVLERHKYPVLRRLPSFDHHTRHPAATSEWRRFFWGLNEGTNIAQSIIAKASWENVEPLPGLTRDQSHSVFAICQAPWGWEGDYDEWRYDRELVLQAISQHMSQAAFQGLRRVRDEQGRLIIPDVVRERARLAAVPVAARGIVTPIEYYDMAPSTVNSEGKLSGLNVGIKYLDYDIGITTHGLVLKEQDGTLCEPPKIIEDWFLLYYSRDHKFIAFERTVIHAGQGLRLPILEELAFPAHEQFQFSRLLRIFFQQRYGGYLGQPFQLRSGPAILPRTPAAGRGRGRGRLYGRARGRGRGGGGPAETAADIADRVPRFVDLFRETMQQQPLHGIEQYVWDYHLENDLNKIDREMRQVAAVQRQFIQFTDPDHPRQRPVFSLWTITYTPPQA
ncbi:predicted protein [Lichtheimia corymbifera JMRC:FSU:9682]|uniref:Uncharacterized protein n=1 Tax=Lichtheimia corymbifera JMRC:FSU:9682 TaxID=1263082 RepID=A0A068SCP6_9FUNG|nr:predicted protein [Lichtheimia corymbifera JMRC:FSU:9682]